MAHNDSAYEAASGRLIVALGDHAQPAMDDLAAVQAHLDSQLRVQFPALNLEDRQDVIGDGLMNVMRAARAGRIEAAGSPGGYLWKAIRNRAVDYVRGRPPTTEVAPEMLAAAAD